MHDNHTANDRGAGLQTPLRNNYFYGQLLGVQNFELETGYAIGQRRLLNRLVLGYGVICGLGVEVADDGLQVRILPGVAINRRGEEIVVPHRSRWIKIPADVIASAMERAGECKDACVQVLICYHECRSDPAQVLAGDCRTADPCAPSTIREQYRIELRDECADRPEPDCSVPDGITNGRLDHEQLARWVTYERDCTRLPHDPCLPLANLRVIDADKAPRCDPNAVDITVRPILPSNVVLRELILALLGRERQQRY